MYAAAGVAVLVGIIASGWNLVARGKLTPAPSVQAVSAKIPAIAVMPFTNAGSDRGNDDFVDGLTSEVIHNLASISGLETRSQTSSFFFKARPRDVHDISKQLGVDYIVEATVHRAGNRLRINAQLVRIPDDVPEWTESFDRTFDDVFAIQDEISRAIVNRLRLKLGSGQRRYQPSLQAYELYLRAKALISRKAMGQDAIRLFEQATIIDPGYAQAYAGLAAAYAARSWPISGGLSLDQGLEGMRPAAAKALQIDPLLAEAHVAMGVTYATELRWEDATKSFERALELEPTFTQTHAAYARTLITLQQPAKAVELLTSALKVDPLSIDLVESLAWAQFQAGRYDESIATWRQVLATDPTISDQGLARTLTAAGRPLDAIAVWESRPRADRLAAEGDWERWITRAYVLAGRSADVQRILDAPSNTYPFRQALIYAAVRDKDRTFEALNRAVDETPHRVAFTLAAPEMAFLRGDPRFDALRKRLHLQ
jgi:TolB-like protein/Tfp pilus assembly protein PilF